MTSKNWCAVIFPEFLLFYWIELCEKHTVIVEKYSQVQTRYTKLVCSNNSVIKISENNGNNMHHVWKGIV